MIVASGMITCSCTGVMIRGSSLYSTRPTTISVTWKSSEVANATRSCAQGCCQNDGCGSARGVGSGCSVPGAGGAGAASGGSGVRGVWDDIAGA
jgi:hypothetical protein